MVIYSRAAEFREIGMDRKTLRIPVDSATAGVFCASQQARLAVVRALI
jgi:hypothetical protein